MKKILFVLTLFLVAGTLGFAGCAKKPAATDIEGTAGRGMAGEEAAGGMEAGGVTEAAISDMDAEAAAAAAAVRRIEDVFFDYDSYGIRADARKVLEANADLLRADMSRRITIEGHCDERGSSEYNIALGQRRAESVQRYLVNLGVNANRIKVVSYGKEKPFCTESDEACWQKNRRAHFVVR